MAAIHGDWYASRSTHDGEAYPQSDGTVRFVYSTQPDGEKYIVAKVWAGDDQDYESTAKLIAAAPELLAALKRLLPMWEEAIGWEKDYMDMADDARAAIAKAEGRSE